MRKSLYEIFWQRKTQQIESHVNFYDNLMEAWKLNESPDYKLNILLSKMLGWSSPDEIISDVRSHLCVKWAVPRDRPRYPVQNDCSTVETLTASRGILLNNISTSQPTAACFSLPSPAFIDLINLQDGHLSLLDLYHCFCIYSKHWFTLHIKYIETSNLVNNSNLFKSDNTVFRDNIFIKIGKFWTHLQLRVIDDELLINFTMRCRQMMQKFFLVICCKNYVR